MKNIFTDHPHSVGESYFVHFKYAIFMSFNLLRAGLACFLHAVFPFLFKTTGSCIMIKSMHRLIERKTTIDGNLLDLLSVMESKRVNSHKI